MRLISKYVLFPQTKKCITNSLSSALYLYSHDVLGKKLSCVLFFFRNMVKCNVVHTYIPLTLYPRRGSRGISDIAPRPTFYQNYLAVRNSADVTGGRPNAVWSQFISGVNAINPIVALFDIHGRKRCYSFILSGTPHETNVVGCVKPFGFRLSIFRVHRPGCIKTLVLQSIVNLEQCP
jgi:hypothetical protein